MPNNMKVVIDVPEDYDADDPRYTPWLNPNPPHVAKREGDWYVIL